MNFGRHASIQKQQRLHSTSTRLKNLVGTSAVKLLVFALVLGGAGGFMGGLGAVNAIIDSAPETSLADVQPRGYATILYADDGVETQRLHAAEANRIYVEYEQIPAHVRNAFIAIEDERFWEHNGIDAKGIVRAIFSNLEEGDLKASGASTITQQLIKNNVLSTQKSWERKIQEQYLAVELEKKMTKEQILEYYLNTAACGRGTNGVQSAANTYFNKDVGELTIAEAAAIAGITQRPSFYDPVANPENNRVRQLTVLAKMEELGYITPQERAAAEAEDVYDHIQLVQESTVQNNRHSYFVDEVIQRVAEDLRVMKGYTENQAYQLIYRGGLRIQTTQNLQIQKTLDEVFLDESSFPPHKEDYAVKAMVSLSLRTEAGVKNLYKEQQFPTQQAAESFKEALRAQWLEEWQAEEADVLGETVNYIPQPQAAMVISDYHNGHVKALNGGRGPKTGNQTFNRATQAKRQPGSTFKVLAAYVPAIDVKGYTLATVLDDVPTIFRYGTAPAYIPKNWYDTPSAAFNYRGLSTVREGIADSMNILAVRTIHDISPQLGYEYLLKMGFTTLVDDVVLGGKTFSDKTLSLPLGGLTSGVTPLELNAAYGTIANKGIYVEPVFYTQVLDHNGNVLLEKVPVTHTVMKETTAFLLTSAMESVVKTGTATQVQFQRNTMAVAGKTGTTSDNYDVVFAGYTPYYAATIWMGYDTPARMAYLQGYHKFIWRDVMDRIHDGLPYKEFTIPPGIVQAPVCNESGKLPTSLCSADPRGGTVRYEYFVEGTQPTESCDVHVAADVCTVSGLLATQYCPEHTRQPKVFIKRPEPVNPEAWAGGSPPRIADARYQLPGTYCNFHGPILQPITPPKEETPEALPQDPVDFGQ
ncbi:transglycosylase domain-containing protein [Anaerotalea alkaliphila]|uniref:Penicillin-binding protein 1A n=1 Tax=Anaerotalea alkaliphila TaxID=2662126 RepID=A0A7X5KN79_9FIRM|nr:PBP1A family penicillin-binding protein [Anaerotalea alkaliphila]NDL67754.1 PBP1A family penicillin-binding protein [Anaerotalea alkaliphila]